MNVECSSLEGDAGGAGTEDCLKLNVYAPFGAKSGDNRVLSNSLLHISVLTVSRSSYPCIFPWRRWASDYL